MVRGVQTKSVVRETVNRAKAISKYRDVLKEVVPNFDRLSRDQQSWGATMKSLQEIFPDDPTYSDKKIREKLMGLAVEDYQTTDKDDLGRDQLVGKMKQQNPAGFKKGGKVKKYRGRKAMGNKD